ncbi:MAG TPA: DUF3604 domain-containing protein, partial [Pseudomonadales bacterium]
MGTFHGKHKGPGALATGATACLLAAAATAKEFNITAEVVEGSFEPASYSPYAGRNFPSRLLWGDTHLHTSLSLDARAAGVILDPEAAYRFARGEEIRTTAGMKIRIGQPLDFLVITDHS